MRRPAQKLFAAFVLVFAANSLTAQDWAKAALLKSPRHYEFVPIKHGDRTVEAFVVYPEVSRKAPVVVMIHEIFGLSDWAKLMADELAAQGYIVVEPDLLSGCRPQRRRHRRLSHPPGRGHRRPSQRLNADQVTADLDAAAADYGKKPSCRQWQKARYFVARLLLGRRQSPSASRPIADDLSAAFVFYGTPPADVTAITAPVYGFYAGNDARITATVPATTEAMKAAGKKYDPVIYDGAGHGFMRAGQDPATNDANKKACCTKTASSAWSNCSRSNPTQLRCARYPVAPGRRWLAPRPLSQLRNPPLRPTATTRLRPVTHSTGKTWTWLQ